MTTNFSYEYIVSIFLKNNEFRFPSIDVLQPLTPEGTAGLQPSEDVRVSVQSSRRV